MLHTLSYSPHQTDFSSILRNIACTDAVLLMQDGVIAALEKGLFCNALINTGAKLFVLVPDMIARGITEHISSEITPIDYTEFVELTVKYSPQIAW